MTLMMADLLDSFPPPDRLRELCVALAVLDVAMSPDDEPDDRIFRFDPRDPSGVAMASMDNGQGDRYYIAFGETAVFGWGFAHEYPNESLHADARRGMAWAPGRHACIPAAPDSRGAFPACRHVHGHRRVLE